MQRKSVDFEEIDDPCAQLKAILFCNLRRIWNE